LAPWATLACGLPVFLGRLRVCQWRQCCHVCLCACAPAWCQERFCGSSRDGKRVSLVGSGRTGATDPCFALAARAFMFLCFFAPPCAAGLGSASVLGVRSAMRISPLASLRVHRAMLKPRGRT